MVKKIIGFSFCILVFSGHSQNIVSTYAGNGTQGFINGDTAASRYKTPFGICRDKNENLYIADAGNNCIRKITPAGIVTTLAGTGTAGYLDGPNASAQFNSPTGVCADDSGNVYVADFQNHRIRKISVLGMVTTIAGNGTIGYVDGNAGIAQFDYPRGICRNKKGHLFVGDSWNHRIRKIANGVVTTYAGGGSAMGVSSVGSHKDAKDTAARFYTPAGLAIDKTGNVYVADAYNHRIRKIDTTGQVTTVAGSGAIGVGNGGYANGAIATASLNTPTEAYVDSTGKIYIGDTFNNRVRMVSSGSLSVIAGKGTAGYVNGLDTSIAQFNYPRGVVCNAASNKIYVVDYNNHSIRKISIGLATGDKEEALSSGLFMVYPNPSKGTLYIGKKDAIDSALLIKMSDVTGRIVFEGTTDLNGSLNLKELEPGLYTLMITDKNSVYTKKIILE